MQATEEIGGMIHAGRPPRGRAVRALALIVGVLVLFTTQLFFGFFFINFIADFVGDPLVTF